MSRPVLVADIGGTNARFAMAIVDEEGAMRLDHRETFQVDHYEHVADAAHAYLESWGGEKPQRAAFAVAAPIQDGVINFTSSAWQFTIDEMRGALELERFRAINDFEAQALGVRRLGPDAFMTLKEGEGEADKPCVVFGPGTGLGLAILAPANGADHVIATEGGHVGFAPGTDKEIEVLKFIRREHAFVSFERLLSGRGLVNIHRALCVIAGATRVSLTPSEITEAALEKRLPIATEAVDMFCALLGAYAGDAVLMTGAQGGAYIAGGIAPRIVEILKRSDFVARFSERGPMSHYMTPIPVRVLISDEAAFYGAATAAVAP